jgi:DNA-binding transcriptional regulator YiaG
METKKTIINKKTLDHTQEDFQYPTYEDVKNLRLALGFNRAELAKVVGTHIDEDGYSSGTVGRWESKSKRGRPIPLSAWYLMLISAGLKPIEIHDISKNIEFN